MPAVEVSLLDVVVFVADPGDIDALRVALFVYDEAAEVVLAVSPSHQRK